MEKKPYETPEMEIIRLETTSAIIPGGAGNENALLRQRRDSPIK